MGGLMASRSFGSNVAQRLMQSQGFVGEVCFHRKKRRPLSRGDGSKYSNISSRVPISYRVVLHTWMEIVIHPPVDELIRVSRGSMTPEVRVTWRQSLVYLQEMRSQA
jgi:hypothetical protein